MTFFQGDNLIIGDKGLNLSKGQKARINLARAVYKDCEIYLLDDCLTALDAHVKDHVFNECVRNFLVDKLCILATNNTEYVRSGDNLMVMENGTVKSFTKATNKDLNDISIHRSRRLNRGEKYEVNDGIESVIDKNDNVDEKTKLLEEEKGAANRNIYNEVKKSGQVGVEVYKKYVSHGGGFFMLGFIMMFFILTQSSKSYTEKMVSNW